MLPIQLFDSASQYVISTWQSGHGFPYISGLPAALEESFCDSIKRASMRLGRPLRFVPVFLGSSISHGSILTWLRELLLDDVFDEHTVPATFLIDLGISPSQAILEALAGGSTTHLAWRFLFVSRQESLSPNEDGCPALTGSADELKTIYSWAESRANVHITTHDKSGFDPTSHPNAIERILLMGHHAHLHRTLDSELPIPRRLLQTYSDALLDGLTALNALPKPLSQQAVRTSLTTSLGLVPSTTMLSDLRNRGWLTEPHLSPGDPQRLWYMPPSELMPAPRTAESHAAIHRAYLRALSRCLVVSDDHDPQLKSHQITLCSCILQVIGWAAAHYPEESADLARQVEQLASRYGQLEALLHSITEHPLDSLVTLKLRAALATSTETPAMLSQLDGLTGHEATLLRARFALRYDEDEVALDLLHKLIHPEYLHSSSSARNAALLMGQQHLRHQRSARAAELGAMVCAAARDNQDTLRMAFGHLLIGCAHRLEHNAGEGCTSVSHLRQSLQLFHALRLAKHVAHVRDLLTTSRDQSRNESAGSSSEHHETSRNGFVLTAPVWAPVLRSLAQK